MFSVLQFRKSNGVNIDHVGDSIPEQTTVKELEVEDLQLEDWKNESMSKVDTKIEKSYGAEVTLPEQNVVNQGLSDPLLTPTHLKSHGKFKV
jgi:hypothetical protein